MYDSEFRDNYGKIGEADLHIEQASSISIINTSFRDSLSDNRDTGISITMVQERYSYFPIRFDYWIFKGTGQDGVPKNTLPENVEFSEKGGSYIYLENSNFTSYYWDFSEWIGARYGGVIYAGTNWVSCLVYI